MRASMFLLLCLGITAVASTANGRVAPAGVYFLHLSDGLESKIRKAMLLR